MASICGRDVEQCGSILHLKIDVKPSNNELFRDGHEVERPSREPILVLKVEVTASCQEAPEELLRDGHLIFGRVVERPKSGEWSGAAAHGPRSGAAAQWSGRAWVSWTHARRSS